MKKEFIYVIAGIIIIVSLVGLIWGINNLNQGDMISGNIQSETMIDLHGNESIIMDEYAYTYGLEEETGRYFVECIDYYETESVLNTIIISSPEKARVETGNQLEIWGLRDICLNSNKEIMGLFIHLLLEKADDGSWKDCQPGEYWLYTYDTKGEVIGRVLLDAAIYQNEVETGAYYDTIVEGKDGNIYILSLYSSEISQIIFELSATGEMLSTRTFDEYTHLCKTASGYTVLCSGDTVEILEESCPYKEEVENIDADFVYPAYIGSEYEFILMKATGVYYGVDTEGKKELIFDTNESYLAWDGNTIYRDESIYEIRSTRNSEGVVKSSIVEVSEDTKVAFADDREVIYIASVYGLSESEVFIRDFNMENTEYRIEILPYYEEADPQKALAEDILTGKEIDIVDLSGMDYESLIEKGMLADIYEFIDEDPDMDISDFDEDILQAYERDGKLYEIVPAYYIGTMVTNGQKVNGYGGWNYDTMCQLAGAQPDRCSDYELFMYGMMSNMEQVYDKENNSCDFNGEWFSDLLTNSAKLPSYNDAVAYSVLEQVEVRGYADCSLSLNDICFLSAHNENQNNAIEISGLPGMEGGFHYIQPAQIFAIISTSDKQDVAWEVCRELLTREYQLRLCPGSGAFATRTDAMDELYEMITATTAYHHDVLGYIEPYSSNIAFGTPMENLTWGPAEEEYIDIIEECKENCRVQTYEEMIITNMVWEEAEPYFAGNGSVQDTIDKIQNRVSIYLWE